MKKITFILCAGVILLGGKNLEAQSQSFIYTGALQKFTIPCATTLTITATGGQGGPTTNALGGQGAKVIGTFTVIPGDVLDVIVGQQGITGDAGQNGGGGGGTYIWDVNTSTLFVAAAGGGGYSSNGGSPAGSGSGTTSPTNGGGSGSGVGGTGGNGGAYGANTGHGADGLGGGGAGWSSNGGTNPGVFAEGEGQGGFDPANGAAGGAAGNAQGAQGGYGGGGGSSGGSGASGGGGGYNGGGGGNAWSGSQWGSGGGGGSFNGGTNQTNTSGVNLGNGAVTIQWTVAVIAVTDTGRVIKNVSCHGGSDGQARAVVTGVGLTYAWLPSGGSKDTAVGLSAGTYTVNVNSACGGSASSTVIITQPNVLTAANGVATQNILCNGGNNGIATASPVGGGSPFTYKWTPTNQTTAAANGLSVGTYTVTVKDACGASATTTVTITQPLPLIVSANGTANVSCNQSNNGSASSNVSNGTKPYTYSWLPSGGNLDTAVGLVAGIYTLNVVDHNGCTGSASVVITQPAQALTASASIIANVLCHGGNTGIGVGTIAGGTVPYTYLWSPLGGTNALANGLKSGTDTLYVTDLHGCTSTASITVTQPSSLKMTRNTTADDGTCTGSAWVVTTGGVLPYVYLWSDGTTSYYVHYTCHGEFCCTVRDAQGCLDSTCMDVISTAGINTIASGGDKINVYPNPNNGQFTIESTLTEGGASSIEIYNVLGAKVYSMNLNTDKGGNTAVNIGNQPNGIYLYRVIGNANGNLLGEGKMVLQK